MFFFQQVNFFFILLEFELKINKDAEKMWICVRVFFFSYETLRCNFGAKYWRPNVKDAYIFYSAPFIYLFIF